MMNDRRVGITCEKSGNLQFTRARRFTLNGRRRLQGDTIVEVMLAFALFTLIAIGSVSIMNRGANMADRSLEITLIREQIDTQAEILRYARDTHSTAWQSIRDNLGSPAEASQNVTGCPDAAQLPDAAFIANLTSTGTVVRTGLKNVGSVYSTPSTFSNFTFSGEPMSSGLWVVPVAVEGDPDTFDMHIRACWQPLGSSRAETLGTIVRLYDSPPVTTVVTPPVSPLACNALDSYANNLIGNPTFAISAGNGPGSGGALFDSDLPNRGQNVYPDDDGINGTTIGYTGGFSLQTGNHSYGPAMFPNSLYSRVFPGDPSRGVPASNTYFYSNPNQRKDQPIGTETHFEGVLWSQTVTVQPNATYDFTGYFDNVLLPASTFGADPVIQLRADGVPLMAPITVPRNPDVYQRVSLLFTTGPTQTSVALDIYDYARSIDGDDFAMTSLALRRCM